MYSSEQIKAYLLWLQERGLQTPVIHGLSHLEGVVPDIGASDSWKSSVKAIFLSDLPLEGHERGSLTTLDFEQKNLLDRMIVAMQLKPEDYFIAAAFPVGVRAIDLTDKTLIETQRKELKELIERRRPCLLITLGQQAGKLAFDECDSFLRHRGKIVASQQLSGLPVLATLHPRDLLRFPGNKRLAWTDLQLGMHYLGSAS